MAEATNMYADVIDELHKLEVPVVMEQTGGMCLALSWTVSNGNYWLLTDIEGPLPWEREGVTGWALGRYTEDGELVGDCLTTDEFTAAAAGTLVLKAVLG